MTTMTANCEQMLEQELLRERGILKQILLDWAEKLVLKANVARERQQLLIMSDAMLSDMGITRAEAETEARKTDLPAIRLNALTIGKC